MKAVLILVHKILASYSCKYKEPQITIQHVLSHKAAITAAIKYIYYIAYLANASETNCIFSLNRIASFLKIESSLVFIISSSFKVRILECNWKHICHCVPIHPSFLNQKGLSQISMLDRVIYHHYLSLLVLVKTEQRS